MSDESTNTRPPPQDRDRIELDLAVEEDMLVATLERLDLDALDENPIAEANMRREMKAFVRDARAEARIGRWLTRRSRSFGRK